MTTKIHLDIDPNLIRSMEQYAQEKGQNISEIVSNYFKILNTQRQALKAHELSPRTQKLRGILKLEPNFDYEKTLTEELSKKYDS